jgi:hypothetical protein
MTTRYGVVRFCAGVTQALGWIAWPLFLMGIVPLRPDAPMTALIAPAFIGLFAAAANHAMFGAVVVLCDMSEAIVARSEETGRSKTQPDRISPPSSDGVPIAALEPTKAEAIAQADLARFRAGK